LPNILECHNITKNFSGLKALNDVSLSVEEGKIVSLIGPNGAGKTTLFNCITGIFRPSSGRIILNKKNRNIHLSPPHIVARAGVARTFQNIRLFANMSVLENVMSGSFTRTGEGLFDIVFNTPAFRKAEAKITEKSIELLKFTGLSDKLYEIGSNLSYGDQRRLEISRALALEPKILLLDEPAAGMNAVETANLIELIRKIRESGVTIFLIEHDMKVVMSLSDKVVVLNYGEKITEGAPSEVQKNKKVIEAYLGEVRA